MTAYQFRLVNITRMLAIHGKVALLPWDPIFLPLLPHYFIRNWERKWKKYFRLLGYFLSILRYFLFLSLFFSFFSFFSLSLTTLFFVCTALFFGFYSTIFLGSWIQRIPNFFHVRCITSSACPSFFCSWYSKGNSLINSTYFD